MRKAYLIIIYLSGFCTAYSDSIPLLIHTWFGPFKYAIHNDEVVITGYDGEEEKVTIPEEIEGFPVTTIGNSAFFNNPYLISVELPSELSRIEIAAFAHCINLISIEIPERVISIGQSAFMFCEKLTSMNLPKNVSYIGDAAFMGCLSIEEYIVDEKNAFFMADEGILYSKDRTVLYALPSLYPEETFIIASPLERIQRAAFSGVRNLTYIEIPSGIDISNGDGLFAHSENLQTVILPPDLTAIGVGMFSHCAALKTIIIPDTVTVIDGYAFSASGLESIALPEALTEISVGAFSDCDSLESIHIPAKVTLIDEDAFSDCDNLAWVRFEGAQAPEIDRLPSSFDYETKMYVGKDAIGFDTERWEIYSIIRE